jgi:uncharacterized protein (DUF1501 family)
MQCSYACGSAEHRIERRRFLGQALGAGVVAGGLGYLARPTLASELARQQKRVIVINMHGGLSQLESWDPKPGVETGGPFRAIPTSVPGLHVSELLPQTAKQMHHLAVVRGVNTKEDDHGKGAYLMVTGRRQTPAADYPQVGAVMAKALAGDDDSLPGHIRITPGGGGGRSDDAAYLGPRFASVQLGGGNPPRNSARPDGLALTADEQRQALRRAANDRFAARRRTAQTDAYTQSYEQAWKLMQQAAIFDVAKEPEKDHERYGKYDFGRHCLLARRLVEHGITFVQVSHSNYDTHNENFNFHLEQLGEFDRSFAALVSDLVDRGLWESTLLVVLSEFGRTPSINLYAGRDHWSAAWSVVLGGAKIQRGAVIGKTNEKGTAVVDGQVDHANLFHTYLQAVGLDSTTPFVIGGRQVPMADPASSAISELLA